jgi:hypothetical protein
VSLPIPAISKATIEFFYVPKNHNDKATKFLVRMQSAYQDMRDCTLEDVANHITQQFQELENIKKENLFFAHVGFSKRGSIVALNRNVKQLS